MASIVDICNQALDLLGDYEITSLGDSSVAARACNRHYTQARDRCLASFGWGFARDRQELAELASAPDFGYSHKFQLPSGYLRALSINGDDVTRFDWTIEGDALLINESGVKLVFIKQVTDPSKFPAHFVDALARLLAHKVCYKITGNRTQQTEMLTQFKTVDLPDAIEVDRQSSPSDRDYRDERYSNSKFLSMRQ